MRLILLFSCFIFCQLAVAQFYPNPKHIYTKKNKRDSVKGSIYIRINNTTGDTAKFFFSLKKYISISKEGIVLEEGSISAGMGSKCGCEAEPNGNWTTRYRNGQLKSQGKYDCHKKIGTWVSYHDNGRVATIQTYQRPYSKLFIQLSKVGLDNRPLLTDLCLSYHYNGQLKTVENYEIVEKFSPIDTIYAYDPDTFEEKITIVEGSFWNPISKKTGEWIIYNDDGTVLSKNDFTIVYWKDKTIRSIKTRFRQVIYELHNPKRSSPPTEE